MSRLRTVPTALPERTVGRASARGVRHLLTRVALAAAIALAGCAGPAPPGQPAEDPLETWNRGVFAFNEAVDTVLIRPVAVTYRTVVPPPVRDSVTNVLTHLRLPISIANDLLQGDLSDAGAGLERFFVNTIVGAGGIADVYSLGQSPRDYQEEDFGQTLAVWGTGEGPYLVLPILGPSNGRDAVGRIVDAVADPVGWLIHHADKYQLTVARTGLTVVDIRERTLNLTDELRTNSVDYYAALRSLYLQYRGSRVREGVPVEGIDIPDFPEFEDIEEFEE